MTMLYIVWFIVMIFIGLGGGYLLFKPRKPELSNRNINDTYESLKDKEGVVIISHTPGLGATIDTNFNKEETRLLLIYATNLIDVDVLVNHMPGEEDDLPEM